MSIKVGSFPAMVARELERARTLHPGKLNSLHEAHSVIAEEFDEFWDEIKANPRNRLEVLKELTHVAAMCQRAAEDVLNVEKDSGANKVFVLEDGGPR